MATAEWVGVMAAIGAGVVGGIIVRIVLARIRADALDAANLDAGRSSLPHEGPLLTGAGPPSRAACRPETHPPQVSSAARRFLVSRAIAARCRRFSFSALAFTIPSSWIEYAQSS